VHNKLRGLRKVLRGFRGFQAKKTLFSEHQNPI
jgi:hypothetical protein